MKMYLGMWKGRHTDEFEPKIVANFPAVDTYTEVGLQFSLSPKTVECDNFIFKIVATPLKADMAADEVVNLFNVSGGEEAENWKLRHVQAELMRASVLSVHCAAYVGSAALYVPVAVNLEQNS